MKLEGILSVSGKPGLYELSARTNAGIIVKDLESEKKFPIHNTQKVSALTDISIYGLSEDKPLGEIYESLYKAEGGKQTDVDLKDVGELRDKLEEVYPEFDRDRVYASDLKKLFKWYNLLVKCGLLEVDDAAEEEESDSQSKGETKG